MSVFNATSVLAQFHSNIASITNESPARGFVQSAYRFDLEKEPLLGQDGHYTIDLNPLLPFERKWGTGETIITGTISVRVVYLRAGGDAQAGDIYTVRRKAADDCQIIADVCENPDNYNSSASGISIVVYEGSSRVANLPKSEIWETRFSVKWRSDLHTLPVNDLMVASIIADNLADLSALNVLSLASGTTAFVIDQDVWAYYTLDRDSVIAADGDLYVEATGGGNWRKVTGAEPQTVDDSTALTLLDSTNLRNGTIRRVESYKDFFFLDKAETRTAIADEVIAGDVSGSWWVRMFVRDTYWARQATWYIDPTNGDDQNEGDVSGVGNALKTLTEYSRRTDGEPLYSDVTLSIASSLNAGDTRIPHRPGTGVTSGSVVGYKVIYAGVLGTPLFTGTITAYTARDGATAQPTLMTISSLPAANTWTSYVGKLVRCDLGGGSTIVGVVVADLGSKQAWISPPINGTTFAATTFTNGQTVSVYDVPSLGTAVARSLKYDYVEFTNLSAGQWEAFGHYNQFTNCVGGVFQYGGTGNYENHSGSVTVLDGNANFNGGKVHLNTQGGASVRIGSHVTLYSGAAPTSAGITCGGGVISTPRGVGVGDVECFSANGLVNFTNASAGATVGLGGYAYGTVSGTDVIVFGPGARQATVSFGQAPSFAGMTGINFVDVGQIGSISSLSSSDLMDIKGNHAVGTAGPTVNHVNIP